MIRPWERTASDVLHDYRIFRLRRDRCRSPRTGGEHDFYVLESPDWVNVVALTGADEVVLIRQYRFGVRAVTLEIPGGLGEPGEDPIEAARRELLEETGFSCTRIEPLGRTHPNPAIQGNWCHTALATGCRKVAVPALDEREDIEVELRPVLEVPQLIASGAISHALVVVAFHHLFARHPSP